MEQILSVIFFIVLGFWLFGVLGRWFLRYWLLKKQRQMEEQMRDGGFTGGTFGGGNFRGFYTNFGGNPHSQQNREEPKKPEGEVTIETNAPPQKGVNSQIGEYVDFEEVN